MRVQERLVREPELTLVKAINIRKTAEISQKQLEVMQPGTQAVNANAQKSQNMRRKPEMQHNVNKQYKYCMGSHKKGKCPAYGMKCRSCGKLNLFSKACLSTKEVHHMEEAGGNETMEQNFDSFFIGILDGVEDGNNDKWEVDLIIEDKNVRCKLDTGAEANVISSKMLSSLKIPTMKIEPTMTKLRAYGGKMITPIGLFPNYIIGARPQCILVVVVMQYHLRSSFLQRLRRKQLKNMDKVESCQPVSSQSQFPSLSKSSCT